MPRTLKNVLDLFNIKRYVNRSALFAHSGGQATRFHEFESCQLLAMQIGRRLAFQFLPQTKKLVQLVRICTSSVFAASQ